MEDDSYDLDLAVASLQSDSGDVHVLLKVLAEQLSGAVGNRLEIKRAGGRFKKSDEIQVLRLTMGDDLFEATVDGATVRCSVGHGSGGIRIRNEQVEMDQWIKRLLGALQAEAAHSRVAREALENILIGGTT